MEEKVETPEIEETVEAVDEVDEVEAVEEQKDDDGWLSVSIDDEPEEEPEQNRDWINHLRRENRELKKWKKEQEAKANAAIEQKPLRPKPTLEDHDYDAASFEEDLVKWHEEKRIEDQAQEELKAIQQKATQRWEQKLTAYDEGKEKFGAPDYEEAELTVAQIFDKPFPGLKVDDARMGIIKQGAKDPNALIYALGKNPAKAKELAEIEDPVEFAFSLGELSGKMKIVRGKAPPPEKKIGGAVPGVAGAMDNTLERLREEAARTGDYSKVAAYKRQKKA